MLEQCVLEGNTKPALFWDVKGSQLRATRSSMTGSSDYTFKHWNGAITIEFSAITGGIMLDGSSNKPVLVLRSSQLAGAPLSTGRSWAIKSNIYYGSLQLTVDSCHITGNGIELSAYREHAGTTIGVLNTTFTAPDNAALDIAVSAALRIEDCVFEHGKPSGNKPLVHVRPLSSRGARVRLRRNRFAYNLVQRSVGTLVKIVLDNGAGPLEITGNTMVHNALDLPAGLGLYHAEPAAVLWLQLPRTPPSTPHVVSHNTLVNLRVDRELCLRFNTASSPDVTRVELVVDTRRNFFGLLAQGLAAARARVSDALERADAPLADLLPVAQAPSFSCFSALNATGEPDELLDATATAVAHMTKPGT